MRFINQYGCGPVTGELTAVDQNKCFAETGDFWRESDFISAEEMCREGYIVPEGTQPPTKIR